MSWLSNLRMQSQVYSQYSNPTPAVAVLPKQLWGFVLYFIKQDKIRFILIGILSFGWALDNLIWPYATKILVDQITDFSGPKSEIWSVLWPILIFWVAIYVVLEIIYRTLGFLLARVLPNLEAKIRMTVFEYTTHHAYRYFSDQLSGGLVNRINDLASGVSMLITQFAYHFSSSALAVVISLWIFFQTNALFAGVIFIWIILHLAICLMCSKSCSMRADQHATQRSLLTGKLVDSLSNILNIQLFSHEQYEYKIADASQEKEKALNTEALQKIEWVRLYTGLVYILLQGVIFLPLLIYAWQLDWITIAEFVMILMLASNISVMVCITGNELPNIFREIGRCQQALQLIQEPHQKLLDLPKAPGLEIAQGRIEFKNVSFGYEPGDLIFNRFNLSIEPKTKIGLVGTSGSGKSTFVNLLLRFFELSDGEITIDYQDIRKISRSSLRKQIAMIPQQPNLFHRTIRENIRYGKLNATDEEIIQAAKAAHCHEFIQKMPKKYDTIVGEQGGKLSGGQRQRIAIARAILKNAPILILDEATSALDSMTEKKIQSSLDVLMAGKTSIIIAHRLSTLESVDRILVFDQGKIIEDGTHAELINRPNGHYAMMWQVQAFRS